MNHNCVHCIIAHTIIIWSLFILVWVRRELIFFENLFLKVISEFLEFFMDRLILYDPAFILYFLMEQGNIGRYYILGFVRLFRGILLLLLFVKLGKLFLDLKFMNFINTSHWLFSINNDAFLLSFHQIIIVHLSLKDWIIHRS